MFQIYQSLPKQVEAVQFTQENKDRVFNSLTGNYNAGFEDGLPILNVTTVHGETAIIRVGDWVVKDDKIGTYYPTLRMKFLEGNMPNQSFHSDRQKTAAGELNRSRGDL